LQGFLLYESILEHNRNFFQGRYQVSAMDILKLNYEFISEYSFYLKSVRNCYHNTTMKCLINFKKMVLICVKNGWLPKIPLSNQLSQAVSGTAFPYWSGIADHYHQGLLHEKAQLCPGYFPVQLLQRPGHYWCEEIEALGRRGRMDGEKWIFTKRQKTGSSSRIPLLPTCLAIMDRYEDHPQCVNEDRLLPVISNQKMNAYLKEIADVCGIKKNLTFHIARHTFATTVTLSNGVPIESVSKMLGHKNLRTTQHYAKILDKKVSEDMKALKDKLTKMDGFKGGDRCRDANRDN
jgi:hypothetical protein